MNTSGHTPLNIVVIGGGFTGVAFVIHAIRACPAGVDLDFTIVEPSAELGRGIAYGTSDPLHRINVPSDRMSLFAGDSTHATRWLKAHDAMDPGSSDGQGNSYVSRARYGEYVAATLDDVVANAASHVRVKHRRATATGVRETESGYAVALGDGSHLETHRVALCFGHTPSEPPGVIDEQALRDPRLVTHPWAPDALRAIPPDASVLLVGTGLTMADVAVTLIERAHTGRITAISRRGLRARPHGLFSDAADFLDHSAPPASARELVRKLRQRIARDEARIGWQPAADALRFDLPRIWSALPAREQWRVVKKLLPFWDVHRFRIAPQIHSAVERAIESGQMSVTTAGIAAISCVAGRLRASLRCPGGTLEAHDFDAVVFCTGPARDIDCNPLVKSLLEGGLARLDAVRIGLDTNLRSQLRNAAGEVSPGLFAFGPMTRGSFGEMTGAPDIARHLERVLQDGSLLAYTSP
ncbi:FAD/NAD(P)-binding protein [Caballeronia udeis]|uniref:FAD/NAD(P)-binding protein n=1 Tax=Caballeronia udeis TaxID=1232866 RepID=UPI0018D30216|nr:FAD/NAD(P)-binding protein [Caballeronia udeis]